MPPKNVTQTKAFIDKIVSDAGNNDLAKIMARNTLMLVANGISLDVIKNINYPNDGFTEEEAKEVHEYNTAAFERLRI